MKTHCAMFWRKRPVPLHSLGSHTFCPLLFSRRVEFYFHLSQRISTDSGAPWFLLVAFLPQTSSHALRGYNYTCLRKKQKEREKKKRKRLLWFVQSQDTFCWLLVVFREPYTVQRISGSVIFLFWWWRCIDICSSAFILCFLLFPYKPLRKKLRDVWVEGWNFYVALT